MYTYLNIVQFIISSIKMLKFLQHCQVPYIINIVVINVQYTKGFLWKEIYTHTQKHLYYEERKVHFTVSHDNILILIQYNQQLYGQITKNKVHKQ